MPLSQITPEELSRRLEAKEDFVILDVRMPIEWESIHIEGAVHKPLHHLGEAIATLPKDKRISCICAHGNRSQRAASILHAAGFNAENVYGGMAAFVQHEFQSGKITEEQYVERIDKVENPAWPDAQKPA